jgi:hypothetical protein
MVMPYLWLMTAIVEYKGRLSNIKGDGKVGADEPSCGGRSAVARFFMGHRIDYGLEITNSDLDLVNPTIKHNHIRST